MEVFKIFYFYLFMLFIGFWLLARTIFNCPSQTISIHTLSPSTKNNSFVFGSNKIFDFNSTPSGRLVLSFSPSSKKMSKSWSRGQTTKQDMMMTMCRCQLTTRTRLVTMIVIRISQVVPQVRAWRARACNQMEFVPVALLSSGPGPPYTPHPGKTPGGEEKQVATNEV